MKTCCVQNEAAVPLQMKQFHLYFKHLALQAGLESEVLLRSARPLGRVPEVVLGCSPRFWEMVSPGGAALGTTPSAPGVLLSLKHKRACCTLNGYFLPAGIGLRYENETSKINTDVKRLCCLPLAKGCYWTRGCGVAGPATTRMCDPVRRDFGILGRRTCPMNARLLSASSPEGV